ncbi:MAG: PDDEXK nuclease domain-containing protein [Kiritimatiellae bacterium]|nr:PDDEXK nuclease domain-containing protein [Kiritimatiellia bacterium]
MDLVKAGASVAGNRQYREWVKSLKSKIRRAQAKAAVRVNEELMRLYWEMGRDIAEKRMEAEYGSGFFGSLSKDLKQEFPNMEGFSVSNLKYIKRFYLFYAASDRIGRKEGIGGSSNRQQPVDDLKNLFLVPWGHNIEIFTHAKSVDEALFYVCKTVENGWSRNVLMNMMESDLYHAKGRAVTNFAAKLPAPESDLAQQTLKDPYCFDFLALRERYSERELEDALMDNMARFLLELGSGFSFVGRQFRLEVEGNEYFIDLLFYHLGLRRFVVVELKTGELKPEDVGQLGFYVQAVNEQLKHPSDGDAIGLLICKRKKRLVAEYALKSSTQLLGVSEYKLTKLLPQDFKSSLPSVKDIEAQLAEKSHVEQKHKERPKARHSQHAANAERQIADARKGAGK